jgi:low affinity Fe/Cu permease
MANVASRWFSCAAQWVSRWTGRSAAFMTALGIVLLWAVTGPLFHFSDTWQLVINTGTTVITFLMVFLIQNTQNRDTEAVHVKLDELIRVTAHARDKLMGLEDRTEEELEHVKAGFARVAGDGNDR